MGKDLIKILSTILLPSICTSNAFGLESTLSAGSSDGKSKTLEVTYTIGEAIVGYSTNNSKAKYIVTNGYEVGVAATKHIIHYYVADKEYATDTFYTGELIIPVKDPYVGHDEAFTGWDDIIPETMPSKDLILNAIIEERTYDMQLADNFCPGDTITIQLSSNGDPSDIESFSLDTDDSSFPVITDKKFKHEDGVAIASFVLPTSYDGGRNVPTKMTINYFDGYKRELKSVDMNIGYNKKFMHVKVDNTITIGDLGESVYSYQWQKDGEDIPDATGHYFQDINGLNGTYSLIVGTDEGFKTVCPQSLFYVASEKKGFASESVVVNRDEEFELVLDGFTADEIRNGTIIVFDYKGSLALAPISKAQKIITLKLTQVGVYAVAFTQGKNKRYTTKVIVK